MSKTLEITLGEQTFKASYFTVDQAVDTLPKLLVEVSSGDFARYVKGCSEIIATAISKEHPDFATGEKVRAIPTPLRSFFEAVAAILKFNEYEFDAPGKPAAGPAA